MHADNALSQLTIHISTNDLHCCKPARLLQLAPSGGRPRRGLSLRPGGRPHASARHRTPTHCPTSPTSTDCTGRLMACLQQTAPPQQCISKDDTAHPHQPWSSPDPPHPDPAHSRRHHPAKTKVKFPLRTRISLGFLVSNDFR
jgi:hypothetical protein